MRLQPPMDGTGPVTYDRLARLGELLAALADTERTERTEVRTEVRSEVRWTITSQLGSAGKVAFGVAVNPQRLSDADRDAILTFAARLTNWHHQ